VAKAEDSAQRLAAVVTQLNDWIVQSPEAEQWRIFLDLNALETLVGRGYRADVGTLAGIQQRFTQSSSALSHSNFESVATAIQAHMDQINAADAAYPSTTFNAADLSAWATAFQSESTNLKTMTSAQLNAARMTTLNQIVALDQFLNERGALTPAQLNQPLAIFDKPTNNDLDVDNTANPSNPAFDLSTTIKWLSQPIVLEWETTTDAADDAGSLAEIVTALKQEQTDLKGYSRKDPNPYAAYANLLLEDYVRTLNLGRRENLPDLLARQVENLIEALPEWKPGGDRLSQATIVRTIGYLEATDQSQALTAAFKRTFWRNNAVVSVGETLVNRFATRPVSDTQPVNEVILDNQVYGTATTNGQVSIDFVPNDLQAHVSLYLSGNIHSDNYSPVGPITVFTGSQGQVEARRSIYLNVGGWYQKAPYGSANLASFFKDTSCGRLIDQVAEKQFDKQREGAVAIASRRAEKKLLNEFSKETNQALNDGRKQADQTRDNASVIKPFRPTLYTLTSEHFLQVYASKYANSQMAALTTPPVLAVPCDIAVQYHDSLINNYLEDELSGLKFSSEDLERITEKLKQQNTNAVVAEIGDDPQVEAARDPFELIFNTARPVDLQFEDQLVKVTVNIRRFSTQGQAIDNVQVNTKFKMRYDFEGTPGIRLVQIGGIEARLADPSDIDLNSATILDLIESTINDELNRQHSSQTQQGIKLPMNLIDRSLISALAGLEGAEMLDQARLVVISFENGWASLAWRMGQTTSVGYSISDSGSQLVPGNESFPTQLPAIESPEAFQQLLDADAATTNGD